MAKVELLKSQLETLKNSIPFTRVYCKGLAVNGFANLRIIMPDPGSAALANRDWARADGHTAVAFERFGSTKIGDSDDAVVVVAAAAADTALSGSRLRKLRLIWSNAHTLSNPSCSANTACSTVAP